MLGSSNCGGSTVDGFACLVQPQLLGGLVTGVATDDDAFRVDHDGLVEAELPDRRRHGVNSRIVLAGIALVETDICSRKHFDGHR
jgi:hypothetical protein